MPEENTGIRFIDVLNEYEAVKVCDAAYEIYRDLVGSVPYDGEKITIAAEGYDGEENHPGYAGLSGNPIHIVYDLKSQDNSILTTLGSTDMYPTFGLYFHEMGHGFTLHPMTLNFKKAFGYSGAQYVEGFARFFPHFISHMIIANAEKYELSDKTIQALRSPLRLSREFFLNSEWTSVLFLFDIIDEYGWDVFPRFFEILNQLDLAEESWGIIESDTIFIAVMSAATDTDLRDQYRQMGFYTDNSFFESLGVYHDKNSSEIEYLIEPDKILYINGTLVPAVENTTITFTFVDPGSRSIIEKCQTGADGKFSASFFLDQEGLWSLRVSWLGNDDYRTIDTQEVSIERTQMNMPPTSIFLFSPSSPTVGVIVGFSDRSVDPEGDLLEYQWDFGDGSTSTKAEPVHTYDEKGDYTVTLTVTDDEGLNNSFSKALTVDNQRPYADFRFSPSSPKVGDTVIFSDQSSDPDGDTLEYLWEFADGSTSTQRNPQHVYSSPGMMRVWLTVTDDDGAEYAVRRSVMVEALRPAEFEVSDLLIEPSSVFVGEEVTVTALCTNVGEESGEYSVTLMIDGEEVDEKSGSLDPGESESVLFEVVREDSGTHRVEVEGQSGSFIVNQKGIPGFSTVSVILGILAAAIILGFQRTEIMS